MEQKQTERDLVARFKSAKLKTEEIEKKLNDAEKEYDAAEAALIELLEANSAVATARYDGIGYAKMKKPKLFASCNKEFKDDLFKFLKTIKREDLIKKDVPASSLSIFVSERIEQGEPVPDYVRYYLRQSIQLFE